MSEPKDQTFLPSHDDSLLEAGPESGDELLYDEGDDILFDQAELVDPNEIDGVIERATESGSAWQAPRESAWSQSHAPAPSSESLHAVSPPSSMDHLPPVPAKAIPSGLMDTVVEDDPSMIEKLLEQEQGYDSSDPDAVPALAAGISPSVTIPLQEDLDVTVAEGSRHNLESFQGQPQPTPSRPSHAQQLVQSPEHGEDSFLSSSMMHEAVPDDQRPSSVEVEKLAGEPHPFAGADFDVTVAVEGSGAFAAFELEEAQRREALLQKPIEGNSETIDESGDAHPASDVSPVSSGEASLPPNGASLVEHSPYARAVGEDEDPGEVSLMGSIEDLSPVPTDSVPSLETLPLHAMDQEQQEQMLQRPGVRHKYARQFEKVIDDLSREGIGSREWLRDELSNITAARYELIHASGIELDQAFLTMIAEEQEAVWEQLCAHVDLYKDYLYQLLHELEDWNLSNDCCPNLLCRAPREKGHSICRRCQSEFFLVCPSCKSQTPYFSERCQQIQCGQAIPPEEKLNAAVKITNAFAQRQGKASSAAAAAFVLYYLMERFSITTRGDWFDQIDRYRKLQAKVNQEYQRRCLIAYQDELQRILEPAFERLRQETLRQVSELYAESRFLDSLETLNAMPSVLRDNQVEEVRHRIYERLTEGELNRIESLIQEGKLEQANLLLQDMAFESPRRQRLVEQCRHILTEKEQHRRLERRSSVWNVLFVVLLAGSSALHWLAMPEFLGKRTLGWIAPYAILVLSGGWLLRSRTVDARKAHWLLAQTVAMMALFGGVLCVLLGLLFSSWYLTLPATATLGGLMPGYRLAPSHATIIPAFESWRIVTNVAIVGGMMGLLTGGFVGSVLGSTDTHRRRVLWNALLGALGVSLGVSLISAVGITVGSAISVLVFNTFAAAVAVASITAIMVSVGVEVGLKIASDMNLERPVWGGTLGACAGALIGALFGAGVVHNGMNPNMKLIHPDVAWTGVPLAMGVVGAIVFVFVMFRWGGVYLRTLRWGMVSLLTIGSALAWLLLQSPFS
ncbi:MAG: hypothetical protein EP343_28595 [Deltaproteobacteria bacterium]|nr:MAG: hypothetical protein EP343_28595 [Deltaproteobacteria bacterium]